MASDAAEKKQKKRGIFGFGKKKAEDTARSDLGPRSAPSATAMSSTRAEASGASTTGRTASNVSGGTTSMASGQSPRRTLSSSPGARALSTSPRLTSPAGSQIFERDVQESAGGTALLPTSSAVPSHIQTENHIPPVLDASSEAITDIHLNPDTVEIITHASHQSAASAVASPHLAHPGLSSPLGYSQASGVYGTAPSDGSGGGTASNWADELAAFTAEKGGPTALGDSASYYGSFDTTDVRRLSFISFADVVQAEHAGHGGSGSVVGGNRDSLHMPPGLTSLPSLGMNRSSSPIRSPVSSTGEDPYTSPTTSKSGSIKGMDMSPGRKSLGSPNSFLHGTQSATGPNTSGELTIETMAQALRRTRSGELGGSVVKSLATSPV